LPYCLSAISSGVRRRKREHVMVVGDEADVLVARAGVEALALAVADAVAPVFVWRERGGKREVVVGVATVVFKPSD
jgi:hypothetical protein